MLIESDERREELDEVRSTLQRVGDTTNSTVIVAATGDVVLGYVEATGGGYRRNRSTAYVVIGVLAAASGHGIGSQLLAELERWAVNAGVHRLELTVVAHNHRAIRTHLTLTHIGSRDQHKVSGRHLRFRVRFECWPGDDDEDGMSCFVGRLSVEEAIGIMTLGGRLPTNQDAVRYTKAGLLSAAGFEVIHTPHPVAEHVSVRRPAMWDDIAADAFNRSFVEFRTREESDG